MKKEKKEDNCNITIVGVIRSVIWSNKSFHILSVSTTKNNCAAIRKEKIVILKGDLPMQPPIGGIITANCKEVASRQNCKEKTYKINSITLDTKSADVVTFLSKNFYSIGNQTAVKIYNKFGVTTLSQINKNNSIIDSFLRNADAVVSFREKWKELYSINEIISYFAKLGVTSKTISKIYKEYRQNAISIFKKNPYVFTEMSGFGFKKIDQIAMASGISANSEQRIAGYINYVLIESILSGHSCLKMPAVLKGIKIHDKRIKKENILTTLDKMTDEKKIILKKLNKITYIYDREVFFVENSLINNLLSLLHPEGLRI